VLPDAEITRWMPGYQHDKELAALCSPVVRQAVYDHGITLCNYWQLHDDA
jgi:hypothetical protein